MIRYAAIILAMPTIVSANPMDEAMKRVGPAFMCGPEHEYRTRLSEVRLAMIEAGVPAPLADFATQGLDRWVQQEHRQTKAKLTAEDCRAKYQR